MSMGENATPTLVMNALTPLRASPFMTEGCQQAAVATNAFGALQPSESALTTAKKQNKQNKQSLKALSAALFRFSCFGGGSAAVMRMSQAGGLPGMIKCDKVPHLQLAYSSSPRKAYNGSAIAPNLQMMMSGHHSIVSMLSVAQWHDAASQFSGCFDHYQAGIDEAVHVVKELGALGNLAPWIPNPPLAFGLPGTQYVPVPAVTGFAAYWLRDDERTTPFPQPIDLMLKASVMVKKVHASIPGILMRESATEFEIIANPAFMPKFLGLNGYSERYDKSNKVEHSWAPRRDLKMGKGYGKLYMTADGMLIARVWQKPAFSDKVDVIMEEYMRLEQGGEVIVDRMTCLHVESGKRATQLQVGIRRPAP